MVKIEGKAFYFNPKVNLRSNMSVFGDYSRYYNLLYKDKDYAGEAHYVDVLLNRYAAFPVHTLLELGCGTGVHALLLAEQGYSVTGVDQSEEMLAAANANAKIQSQSSRLTFLQGDVRTVKLYNTFDAVISLFHVMSYQATNDDLLAAFASARSHLRPEGVFLFDCWYGPAVLTDRPAVRVKRLDDENISAIRIAEPKLYPNDNLVDVNYHVFVTDKSNGNVKEIKETHRMRYLFKPELERMLQAEGLTLIHSEEWMTGKTPGFDTWGVCFVAKRAR